MTWPRLTLTSRLALLFTLVAAVVLLGSGMLVTWATARHFVDLDRIYLDDKVHLVEELVAESDGFEDLIQRLDQVLDSHEGLYLQLRIGGQLAYGPETLDLATRGLSGTPQDLMQWKYAGVDLRGLSETLQLPATFSSPGQGLHQLQVLVAIDTAHHTHFLGLLSQTLALYLLVATLVCGLLGWWAANRGLAPLKAMRDKARAISSHSLQERMPIEAVPVEFAELAAGLNAMLDRLEKDFQRLMEFSSDLAHELRTPINNLLTQTQVALTQKRTAEAYRDILASNAEEFERLARMVSDMLFLAKTENGIDLPHREHIRLHEEVRALFEFYEAVADDRDIRLTIHGHANIYGDRLMIRRAISNLLSNALRYAKAGTGVEVTLDANDHQISLTVTNQGPTIAAADIPRLFDRFYRADPSRGHPGSEGTGLGLAITKAIVEAHRGSIRANSFAERTSFSVALPAATSPTDKAN